MKSALGYRSASYKGKPWLLAALAYFYEYDNNWTRTELTVAYTNFTNGRMAFRQEKEGKLYVTKAIIETEKKSFPVRDFYPEQFMCPVLNDAATLEGIEEPRCAHQKRTSVAVVSYIRI